MHGKICFYKILSSFLIYDRFILCDSWWIFRKLGGVFIPIHEIIKEWASMLRLSFHDIRELT